MICSEHKNVSGWREDEQSTISLSVFSEKLKMANWKENALLGYTISKHLHLRGAQLTYYFHHCRENKDSNMHCTVGLPWLVD